MQTLVFLALQSQQELFLGLFICCSRARRPTLPQFRSRVSVFSAKEARHSASQTPLCSSTLLPSPNCCRPDSLPSKGCNCAPCMCGLKGAEAASRCGVRPLACVGYILLCRDTSCSLNQVSSRRALRTQLEGFWKAETLNSTLQKRLIVQVASETLELNYRGKENRHLCLRKGRDSQPPRDPHPVFSVF